MSPVSAERIKIVGSSPRGDVGWNLNRCMEINAHAHAHTVDPHRPDLSVGVEQGVKFNPLYFRGPSLTWEDRPAVNTFVSFPLGLLRHVVSFGAHKCRECITHVFLYREAFRTDLCWITTHIQTWSKRAPAVTQIWFNNGFLNRQLETHRQACLKEKIREHWKPSCDSIWGKTFSGMQSNQLPLSFNEFTAAVEQTLQQVCSVFSEKPGLNF